MFCPDRGWSAPEEAILESEKPETRIAMHYRCRGCGHLMEVVPGETPPLRCYGAYECPTPHSIPELVAIQPVMPGEVAIELIRGAWNAAVDRCIDDVPRRALFYW